MGVIKTILAKFVACLAIPLIIIIGLLAFYSTFLFFAFALRWVANIIIFPFKLLYYKIKDWDIKVAVNNFWEIFLWKDLAGSLGECLLDYCSPKSERKDKNSGFMALIFILAIFFGGFSIGSEYF